MDDQRLKTADLPQPNSLSSGKGYATDAQAATAGYGLPQNSYPLEDLEVHEQGSIVQPFEPEIKQNASLLVFSRRKAMIVSIGIAVAVTLFTGASILILARRNPKAQQASQTPVKSQDITLKDAQLSKLPNELQGSTDSLLVNGDIATRGALKFSSGTFVSVIRLQDPQANQIFKLPNSSGTFCLDSNNCNLATAAQLQLLQNRLGQVVVPSVPASSLVNNQAGAVSIQGTSNQISVTTSGGIITLAAPQDLASISSPTFANLVLSGNLSLAGTLALPLNCTSLVNGGTLTTNGLGQVVCADDDGGGAGSIGSPGGTPGTLAVFTAAQTIADSIISQALGTATISGNLSVTGNASAASLALGSALTVANGGTGVVSFTTNGVLYGNGAGNILATTAPTSGQVLLGNGSSVPTFTTISGDVSFTGAGVATIQADSIALTVDTTGNYVQSITAGNGINVAGGSSEGATNTLSVVYGSAANTAVQGNVTITVTAGTGLTGGGSVTLGAGGSATLNVAYGSGANTAVQGNTQLTCPSGSGNLSGGGTVITLGSGGTCSNISITNSPVFSGTLAVQGATATIGANSQQGSVVLYDGGTGAASQTGTVQVINTLAQNTTYILPDPAQASVSICLSTGNCAGAGGGITGSGTPGTLSKFTGSGNTIGDSTFSESGSTLTATGNVIIQGTNSLSLGTSSSLDGSITFHTASGANTVTLQAPAANPASNLVFKLPSAYGASGDCLQSDGLGGLSFTSCTGGPGGGVTSLNSQTGVVTLADASSSSGTVTIHDASTAAKGIAQFNSTNFSASLGVINTIQNIASSSSPTFTGLTVSGLSNGLVTTASGVLSGGTVDRNSASYFNTALNAANGGTGISSYAIGDLIYASGATTLSKLADVASGSCLVSGGVGVAPSWATCPGSGGVSSVNTFTGAVTIQGTANQINVGNSAGTITLSTPQDINTSSSPQFTNLTLTGTLAVQGATATIGTNSQQGSLVLNDGSSNTGTLQTAALGQNTIYTLSDPGGASASICLSTGNCIATGTAGGDLTGSYPNPTIAKLQGTNLNISSPAGGHVLIYNTTNTRWENHAVSSDITISETGVATIANNAVNTVKIADGNVTNAKLQNSSLTVTAGTNLANGGTVSLGSSITLNVVNSPIFSGTVTVQGATTTIGQSGTQGSLVLYDGGSGGSANTATLQAISTLGQNTTYTLPDPLAVSDTLCLLTLANCVGGGSGGAPNGAAYLTIGNDATLTNERAIAVNATNLSVTDGGANSSYTINTIQNIATASSPTFAAATLTNASSLTLGQANVNSGSILFKGSGSANTLTLVGPASPTANTLTLPNETGTLCSTAGSAACTGVYAATISSAITYYVAPSSLSTCAYAGDGGQSCTPSDANTGLTKGAPFATLAAAANAIKNKTLSAPVTIQLADTTGGTCYQPNNTTFDNPVTGGPNTSVLAVSISGTTETYPTGYVYIKGNDATPNNVNITGAAGCAGTTSATKVGITAMHTNLRVSGTKLNYFKSTNADEGAITCVTSICYFENINATSDHTTFAGAAFTGFLYSVIKMAGTLNFTDTMAADASAGSQMEFHTPLGWPTITYSDASNGSDAFFVNEFSHMFMEGATITFTGTGAYHAFGAYTEASINWNGDAVTNLTMNAPNATFLYARQGSTIDEGCGSFNQTCTFTAMKIRAQADAHSQITYGGTTVGTNPNVATGTSFIASTFGNYPLFNVDAQGNATLQNGSNNNVLNYDATTGVLAVKRENGQGQVQIYSAGSSSWMGGTFNGMRSRGTISSPAAVQSGDLISQLIGAGYDGSAYNFAGGISINAAGNWTTTSRPSNIIFSTNNGNNFNGTEAMRIDENQNVGIGTLANPAAKLEVDGAASGIVQILKANATTPGDLLQLQNSSGNVNGKFGSTGAVLTLGRASNVTGQIILNNSTNANTITFQADTTSSSYNLILPASAGAANDCLANTATPGTLQFQACNASTSLQTAYSNSTGGTTPEIKLDATRGGVNIQDANTTLGATVDLFAVNGSNAGGLGTTLFNVQGNGNVGVGNAAPIEKLSVGGGGSFLTGPAALTITTDNPLTAGATTVNVVSTTNYPSTGTLVISDEMMTYTGTTATSFTGVTRGRYNTPAGSHGSGTDVLVLSLVVGRSSSGDPALAVTSNGKVGIGTIPDPALNLTVIGPARFNNVVVGSGCGNSCIAGGTDLGTNSGNINLQNAASEAFTLTSYLNTTASNAFVLNARPNSTENLLQLQKSGSPMLTVNTSGNVGIGTASPGSKLTIDQISTITSGVVANFANTLTATPGSSATATYIAQENVVQTSSSNIGASSALTAANQIVANTGSGALGTANGLAASLNNTAGGSITTAVGLQSVINNTGAGSISNAYNLRANSPTVTAGSITNAYGFYIQAQDVAGVGTGYGVYQQGASDINYFQGNVGIGSATPGSKLTVVGDSTAGSGITIAASITGAQSVANTGAFEGLNVTPTYTATSGNTLAALYGALITPQNTSTGTITQAYGVVGVPQNTSTGTISSAFGLYGRVDNTSTGTISTAYGLYVASPINNGTLTSKYALVTEANAGNVGIGVTTPTSVLHVVGPNQATAQSNATQVLQITGGQGGSAGAAQTGGIGSVIVQTGGKGGNATATNGTPGNGGAITLSGGTAGDLINAGTLKGTGGTVNLVGGTGSAGTGTSINGDGGNVILQGGAKGTGGSGTAGTSGAVIIRPQASNDGSAFIVQTAGSVNLLAADTTNKLISIGTGSPAITSGASGALYVTNSLEVAGRLLVGTTTNGADTNSGQLRYVGTFRNSRTITLKPEYEGATFRADGATNIGTMTAGFCSNEGTLSINTTQCGTSGEDHSYYEWTHNETTDQDYDIIVRYRMGDDFDSTDIFSNHVTVRGFASKSASSSDNDATIALYNNLGAQCGTTTSVMNGTANQWSTGSTITNFSGDSDCDAIDAGEYVTFVIHMTANSTGTTGEIVRMGEIEITYKSTF